MTTTDPTTNRAPRRRSRALELLHRIVQTGTFSLDTIAEALVVNRQELDAYLADAVAIPIERQICIAVFAIERVPALARQGHQLRGQIAAVIAFETHATDASSQAPTVRF